MERDPFDEIRRNLTRIWTEQLYREFDNICFHFSVKLKKPLIQISDFKSRWGQWDPNLRLISLSRALITGYAWDVVLEILKHEMAHQIVNEVFYLSDHTHGDDFQRACQMLGVTSWAAKAGGDLEQEIPTWKDRLLTNDEERLLQKAEKLLALATSSNEHEALLAMSKVRELYEKYNLEQIRLRTSRQHVHVIINSKKRRLAPHHSMIAGILINHFFVEVVFASLYDASSCTEYKTLEIIGTRENVQMAEYVFHFLQNNLQQLWHAYQARTHVSHKSRSSFFLGILAGFDEKLAQERQVKAEPAAHALVTENRRMLMEARSELKDFVHFRHPKLVTRSWSRTTRDRGAFELGKKEGARLNLNRPMASGGSGGIRLLNS